MSNSDANSTGVCSPALSSSFFPFFIFSLSLPLFMWTVPLPCSLHLSLFCYAPFSIPLSCPLHLSLCLPFRIFHLSHCLSISSFSFTMPLSHSSDPLYFSFFFLSFFFISHLSSSHCICLSVSPLSLLLFLVPKASHVTTLLILIEAHPPLLTNTTSCYSQLSVKVSCVLTLPYFNE